MSQAIWLLLLGLVFPAVWGALMHWAIGRLWPPDRRRRAKWLQPVEQSDTTELWDYQI